MMYNHVNIVTHNTKEDGFFYTYHTYHGNDVMIIYNIIYKIYTRHLSSKEVFIFGLSNAFNERIINGITIKIEHTTKTQLIQLTRILPVLTRGTCIKFSIIMRKTIIQ